jgi:hypothetical protein
MSRFVHLVMSAWGDIAAVQQAYQRHLSGDKSAESSWVFGIRASGVRLTD